MGGWSPERDISIKTGAAVTRALREDGFEVEKLLLNRNLPGILKRKKIKFVFIALHGPYGEDGTVQGLLDIVGIPYSGSGVLSSALCMNKAITKCVWGKYHLPTPVWWEVVRRNVSEYAHRIPRNKIDYEFFEKRLPLIVKPVTQGSAVGVSLVQSIVQFREALHKSDKFSCSTLVERYIAGKEITVSIVGDEPLEVIEIRPKGSFYDFTSKYAIGGSAHIIPAELSKKKRKQAQDLALRAYHVLGCEVMARVDMIVDQQGKMYLLEINTIPGMTKTSLLPDAARYEGMDFRELVRRIISYSLRIRR